MKLKKITDLDHAKCITTQGFNTLTADNFAARLKKANLAYKADIADSVYISCTLDPWSKNLNTDFAIANFLFGSVKLTRN